MRLIRNIQVQVCNIANDTAFGHTHVLCTRYPKFPFHPQFMQTPSKTSQSTGQVYKSGHSVILLCGTCCWTVGKQPSAVLLPQLQNVYYAVEKFLMFCYLSSRFFFIWETICYSATLLPQWQSFSHLINILLFCYSPTWVAEFFSFVLFCYSALKFFHQSGSVLVWIRLSVNL